MKPKPKPSHISYTGFMNVHFPNCAINKTQCKCNAGIAVPHARNCPVNMTPCTCNGTSGETTQSDGYSRSIFEAGRQEGIRQAMEKIEELTGIGYADNIRRTEAIRSLESLLTEKP